MKNKFNAVSTLVVGVSLLFTSVSFAKQASRELIYELCSSMRFPTDRHRCQLQTEGNKYDLEALLICADFRFDGDVARCLNVISNNNYSKETIKFCNNPSHPDSEILRCLITGAE